MLVHRCYSGLSDDMVINNDYRAEKMIPYALDAT